MASRRQQQSDATTAGKAIGLLAQEFDVVGQHAFSIKDFKQGGKIPPAPTFSRMIRDGREPPSIGEEMAGTYYLKHVTEVVPLGMVVCEHDSAETKVMLDTVERHAIRSRNARFPQQIPQGEGGKGSALVVRPKKMLMLMVYGARYKPAVYPQLMKARADRRSAMSGSMSRRKSKEPAVGAAGPSGSHADTSGQGGILGFFGL